MLHTFLFSSLPPIGSRARPIWMKLTSVKFYDRLSWVYIVTISRNHGRNIKQYCFTNRIYWTSGRRYCWQHLSQWIFHRTSSLAHCPIHDSNPDECLAWSLQCNFVAILANIACYIKKISINRWKSEIRKKTCLNTFPLRSPMLTNTEKLP